MWILNFDKNENFPDMFFSFIDNVWYPYNVPTHYEIFYWILREIIELYISKIDAEK